MISDTDARKNFLRHKFERLEQRINRKPDHPMAKALGRECLKLQQELRSLVGQTETKLNLLGSEAGLN